MANMMNYLDWRGDLRFDQSSVNQVDGLIFAELSYIDYAGLAPEGEGITLKEAAKRYFRRYPNSKGRLGVMVPDAIHDLLKQAAESYRFGDVVLTDYVNRIDEEKEEQFSAVTFTVDDILTVVAYRGTDDTIVGWKENFNMSYIFPVPAQVDAAAYLNAAARKTGNPLVVVGHSKGGNLAVYAAAYCDPAVQARIQAIYNNDGPGFPTPQIERDCYKNIRTRITTLLPQSSVVGILLEHESRYLVVRSDAVGVWQHNGISWEVLGKSFVYAPRLKRNSARKDHTLHAWLNAMDLEQRKLFVKKLFAIRQNTDARTLTELKKDPKKTLAAINASFDEETKAILKRSLQMFLMEDIAIHIHR